ncbi:hypothetical protein XH83_36955 (plasmid) [Bradyrhizobium sp. CCBAU 53351]|nr:hypothetical protein X265_39055 [Bradyrhizobium guangdongense]QAU51111.1 hypothetical protein XH91_38255 [Bradyrhizobium guangzhouense]QOZ49303.1 hypothetical protein XH89_38005 [Bradyrhizobium sp. CCBAU 53340]QOZ57107.1 hypothetical protein XH90_38445 [Bradyrhizobium sp. CCBAU 53338]QOZ81063.1 hypothetical protein XH83_36955 [Bradyrhizobium sp. CCBAU 53351]GAJ37386.1 hypothetical protein BDOA9_0200030 [Bradyrhizobium sp. DOA9]
MSIVDVTAFGRSEVGWIGADPPAEAKAPFQDRGLTIRQQQITAFQPMEPALLASLAAVVIVQQQDYPSRFQRIVRSCLKHLLDYECRVFVVPFGVAGLPQVYRCLEEARVFASNLPSDVLRNQFTWQRSLGDPMPLPPLPHVTILSPIANWSEAANFLVRHLPGEAVQESVSFSFAPECEFGENDAGVGQVLLKRAFRGYTAVHFSPMTEGRSGAAVYRAYPVFGAFHTMPRFVKLGDRSKIFQEFQNYQLNVEKYVPFNLGPRLNYDLCCLGSTRGVLVGDLIESCESLRLAARSGRAGPAISCLFDRTLQAWYRNIERRDTPLSQTLGPRFPKQFDRRRMQRARSIGSRCDRDRLFTLFEYCASSPVLFAKIHGDLHVDNVQVRGHEALVIDFYANQDGPLVWDIATLEASLLVDAFDNHELWSFDEWWRSIEQPYGGKPLDMLLGHGDPRDPHRWFHEAVRQIRHYAARVASADQYGAALALALLNKAAKDPNLKGPEDERRAAAYVLAERILNNNFAPQ